MSRTHTVLTGIVLVFCVAASAAQQEAAAPSLVVEEATLGEARPNTLDGSFTASRDGARYAYLACSFSMWRRMVNTLTLGRGVNHGKCEVVLDGKVLGPYGGASVPEFSRDGSRSVFVALPNTRNRDETFALVVDGVEGNPREGVIGPPVFSADGKRIAFSADVDGARVFVDGVPSPEWEYVWTDQPFFCGARNRPVYSAKTKDGWAVVDDGKVRSETLNDEMSSVLCLKDGTTVYSMRRKKERFVVVGGELEGPYEDVRRLGLSSDGMHYAFIAKLGKKREVAVLDGIPSDEFEEIKTTVMTRGAHLAVAARSRKKTVVVLDGEVVVSGLDEFIGADFSPNGEHFFVLGKRKKSPILWRDGVESPLDTEEIFAVFNPSGSRLLTLYTVKGGVRVAIEGAESDVLPMGKEGHLGMYPLWVDDHRAVAYGRNGDEIVRRVFRLDDESADPDVEPFAPDEGWKSNAADQGLELSPTAH